MTEYGPWTTFPVGVLPVRPFSSELSHSGIDVKKFAVELPYIRFHFLRFPLILNLKPDYHIDLPKKRNLMVFILTHSKTVRGWLIL